jgi:cell division protein FtsB
MARPQKPPAARNAAEAEADPSAPERWLANIRLSSFTIMIMFLVVLGVIVLAPSLKLLIEQRAQIAGLEQSVSKQKSQVADLRSQVARWSDPAYIEAQARSRLLFAFPGEYSYLVIPNAAAATATDGTPISTHIQTTRVDWVRSLTSSLLTAGLSTATAEKLNSDKDSNKIVSPTQTTTPTNSSGMTGVGQ